MEEIVLLSEDLQPIGTAPKLASHHADTPLHLAFSCYIFNDKGEFLLTQRAASKKVWPGVWTNSVCGHPLPQEDFEAAIRRRAAYELGINALDDITVALPDYRYKTPPFDGIIENEFCPVYLARLRLGIEPNPAEVGAYKWVHWDELKNLIKAAPDKYSYWTKQQVPLLETTSLLDSYLTPN